MFGDVARDVWIQFESKAQYDSLESQMYEIIDRNAGNSDIKIYIKLEKLRKDLLPGFRIQATGAGIEQLKNLVGMENVIVKDKVKK